ncbi:MAG: cytidylyltransferase domain-containing protein [Candidatus Kariarchaeaceae archaeon]
MVAIIQARMGSSRLPGKPLEQIGEWSLIELVLNRVRKSTKVDQVVLATSTNSIDTPLANHVKALGFHVHRGSEDDVLSRFYDAAKTFDSDVVVRITGDCPLVSPVLIDHAVGKFVEEGVDYLSLSIGEEKKIAYPRGLDVEVTTYKALTIAAENATKPYEREHVMPYLYTHSDTFSTFYLDPEPIFSRPNYRLCVDTQKDLELILRIYHHFKERFISTDFKELIEFLDTNPEIALINRDVKQKHFAEFDDRTRQ